MLIAVSYDRSFAFCGVVTSFLFSNFIDLTPLPPPLFLLIDAGQQFINFIYILKNQLPITLIFAIVFFVSISFISVQISMISFLPLTLHFVCSSFSKVVRLGCLFGISLVSELRWYCYKLPS